MAHDGVFDSSISLQQNFGSFHNLPPAAPRTRTCDKHDASDVNDNCEDDEEDDEDDEDDADDDDNNWCQIVNASGEKN